MTCCRQSGIEDKAVQTINRVLAEVENWIAVLAFVVVASITFINVLGRYVFNASLAFTGELAVNMAVTLAMIGTVIAMREKAHLGFSLLHDLARGPLRIGVTIFVTFAVCLFFAIITYYGFWQAIGQLEQNRLTPSLRLPQGAFTMSLPVAGVLCIYHVLANAVADIGATRKLASIEVEADND